MKNLQLLFVLFLFFTARMAIAQEFHVTDPASFQAALTAAQANGEDDIILVAPGTYNISSPLYYGSNDGDGMLTITAEDPANMPVLDGGNSASLLVINNDVNNNQSGDTNDDINIMYLVFQRGQSPNGNNGGGLAIITGQANINMDTCYFFENFAGGSGGGMAVRSSSGAITVRNCRATSNSALNYGGGMAVRSSSGPVSISSTRLSLNAAGNAGGGTFVFNYSGVVEIRQNEFNNNSVNTSNPDTGGGGLAVFSVSSLIVVAENTFSDNGVGRQGGAARIGTQGGGAVNILNNTFTGNSAGGKAGALSAGTYGQDIVTISGNVFLNNRAGDDGGGLFVTLDISPTIPGSTGDGAAMVSNNVFYGNSAGDKGGAFKFRSYHGLVDITNNTATGNNAVYGGGLNVKLIYDDAAANIYNNIIYGNTAGSSGNDVFINSDAEPDQNGNWVGNGTGSPVSFFNNDIGPNNDNFSGNSADLLITNRDNYTHGNNIDYDPALTAPGNGDFHLQPASLCINAGFNNAPGIPDTDFEGDPRIINGTVDIGADETFGQQVLSPVPVMGHWGLILLGLLLTFSSFYYLKHMENLSA